ncbi:hypothetical protein D3C85_1804380 [compost metagenome]
MCFNHFDAAPNRRIEVGASAEGELCQRVKGSPVRLAPVKRPFYELASRAEQQEKKVAPL